MSDQLQPRHGSLIPHDARRFDARSAQAFVYKYTSLETRKAYGRAIQDFFESLRWPHQSEITREHVIAYREQLLALNRRPRTIVARLAALRSYFEYLVAEGTVARNPASTKLVTPPKLSRVPAGRALSKKHALNLLAAPDRRTADGARDHAMMLVMLRLSLRIAEVCALRRSSIRSGSSAWVLTCRIKGGREEHWPLPVDVKGAIDAYLRLDESRRRALGTDGTDAWLFQPHKNHRTLLYDKPISQRQVQKLVAKWGDYSGVGKLTPHDLRRTCLTEMLKVYPAHKVQKVSKHRDLNTLMGYNHDRENLEDNPVNDFSYDDPVVT
jgi:site-specific recombinase XerD